MAEAARDASSLVDRLFVRVAALPAAARSVIVLGLSFRPNVDVTAHTNAVDLLHALRERGANVYGHDPLLNDDAVRGLGFQPADSLTGFDAAVVHAYHNEYRDLDWPALAPLIVDARNALDPEGLVNAGVRYFGVGRPLR